MSSDGTTPLGEQARFAGGLQRVAEGAYAWIQPNGGLGESNAGLIVGEGESLLIDTLWDERLTARMLEAMAVHTGTAPIRNLFNSHGDGDHWYGNALLDPGVEIVSTAAALAQMKEEPPSILTRFGPLPAAAGLVGSIPALPGAGRLRGFARFAEMLSNYDFDDLHPRFPDRTFERAERLEIGGRTVKLIEVGPAHTPGDAIAWLPDQRILYAADIVFSGVTPIIWAGPASNCIAALERIEELGPGAIVPGHGPVCDGDVVAELKAYWEMLIAEVRADGGERPNDLARRIVGSGEYRGAPWGGWSYPERTAINVAMVAREVREGKTGPVSTPKRISMIAAMGELGLELGP